MFTLRILYSRMENWDTEIKHIIYVSGNNSLFLVFDPKSRLIYCFCIPNVERKRKEGKEAGRKKGGTPELFYT